MGVLRAETEPRALAAPEHVLFYDAVCPLCTRSVETLRRRGLLEGVEARPIDDAASLGLTAERADALRSEMLVWSRASGDGASGFDGLLRLLAIQGKWPALQAAFRFAPLRALGRSGYLLASLNRRIISPPATGGVACACDPPYRLRWRAALLVILIGLALLGTFLFGMALSALYPGSSPAAMGLRAVAAAGAGWVVGLGLVGIALPRRFGEALWQGFVVMAVGIAALAPFAFSAWLLTVLGAPPLAARAVHVLGVAASSICMLRSTIRRHRHLGFPPWTPWLWFVGMWAGAAPLAVLWWT